MNYTLNRYDDLDDSLGPNDVEFPSDENDQHRDRDIENLRPLNFGPTTKMSHAPRQPLNSKNSNRGNFNNAFQNFVPGGSGGSGGILKNSQHIQKMQKEPNKFNNKHPDRNNNNGSFYNKNPKFQRNNQQPPLFRDEQDHPVEDFNNRRRNSPKPNPIMNRENINPFSQNNFQMNSTRPPSKFVYSNQNSMNNNFHKTSFNNNNNNQHPNGLHSNSNHYQQKSRNDFHPKSQSNSNDVNPQNNIFSLFGNLSNLLKSNNNNNNSMMMMRRSSSNNDQSNSMALSTIFESVALLQALSNPDTLSQTLNLLNTIKHSNPNLENNKSQPIPEPAKEVFSPEDPSGSEIMGNSIPVLQKENSTHSSSFLKMLNKNKAQPQPTNKTPPPHTQKNGSEKENQGINKNQLASKLQLLLSVPPKEIIKIEDEEEEIKTPEISPEKSPQKNFLPQQPQPLAETKKPQKTFNPPNPSLQLLNSQLMNFQEEPKQQQPESPPRPKLLDFFEDKVQIGSKEKEVEKHQRQYKLMGSDRPLLTQEKNLVEKIERFANEKLNPPEEKKQDEKGEKEDDEFNFESRYFMYNPTQVCNRCRKPGHFEKMCTEENLIKCGFCVGFHKMANCDQIVCFKCLKVGHRMQNCQSQHSVTCFRCQKKGHTYHNCGVMMAKDPKTAWEDKQRDMSLIKCSSCNQSGHVNCKFISRGKFDDLYQDYV